MLLGSHQYGSTSDSSAQRNILDTVPTRGTVNITALILGGRACNKPIQARSIAAPLRMHFVCCAVRAVPQIIGLNHAINESRRTLWMNSSYCSEDQCALQLLTKEVARSATHDLIGLREKAH